MGKHEVDPCVSRGASQRPAQREKSQVAMLMRERDEKIVELDNVRQDLKWAADSHTTQMQELVDAQKSKDAELKTLRRAPGRLQGNRGGKGAHP